MNHLILWGFFSAFEEGFSSGKNINHGLPQLKCYTPFFFLKGDAVGDKPLEVHGASNKEQTQK